MQAQQGPNNQTSENLMPVCTLYVLVVGEGNARNVFAAVSHSRPWLSVRVIDRCRHDDVGHGHGPGFHKPFKIRDPYLLCMLLFLDCAWEPTIPFCGFIQSCTRK